MSGRLKISGKKSYCPWKAQNVARVRADEKRHREQERQTQARDVTGRLEQRWNSLSAQQQEGRSSLHVDLFAKEEQQAILQTNEVQQSAGKQSTKTKAASKQVPFYMQAPTTTLTKEGSVDPNNNQRERDKRRRLDPMSQYHPHEYAKKECQCSDKERKRSNRKSSPHSWRSDSSSDDDSDGSSRKHRKERWKRRKKEKTIRKDETLKESSTSLSMQELRRKRIERELEEKERQKALARK